MLAAALKSQSDSDTAQDGHDPSDVDTGDGEESAGSAQSSPGTDNSVVPPKAPQIIVLEREGLAGKLTIGRPSDPKYKDSGSMEVFVRFVRERLPRVELFRPVSAIPDEVSFEEVDAESHEFLKGIFYYADLDPSDASLFQQTDTTERALDKASARLNETLRADWSQGRELRFRLRHESKADRILLRLEDPAVSERVVRVSQRSTGFTNFFALKTTLYARQRAHPAASHIFLFDEPGLHLHPSGQLDLLRVLDTIGNNNQVVYSTHSIFMINRARPTRHRLLIKSTDGTRVDGKPYAGRWGRVLETLGLSTAGTVFFAPFVLLVEGDSDGVYIFSVLQKLIELGAAHPDLNSLAIVATGQARNADALLRMISEGDVKPTVGAIFDGDDGGKKRLKLLQPLLDKRSAKGTLLIDNTAIEDYCILPQELFVKALSSYAFKVARDLNKEICDPDEVYKKLQASYRAFNGDRRVPVGLATWMADAAKEVFDLPEISSLGVAREYAQLLLAAEDVPKEATARALKLLEKIREVIELPELRDSIAAVTD